MNRKVVFVGNCQLGSLKGFYERWIGVRSGEKCVYIPSYESASEEQLDAIATADTLFQQVVDFEPKIGQLTSNADVYLIPHITAAFLWPCAGQGHPKNTPHKYADGSGPYGAELGDSFLNRMILDGVDASEAVLRYMEADIAILRKADRFAELILDKQRSRDELCGFRFAEFIESKFRTERLFRSPNHPDRIMSQHFAIEVFRKLKVKQDVITLIEQAAAYPEFPPTETPIHHSIISSFGLSFVEKSATYRFFDEGKYSSEEFAGRYMRYEWNPVIREGCEYAWTKKLHEADVTLRRAIEITPRSPLAHSVLADVLFEKGEKKAALDMAIEALRLDPENAHYGRRLAHIKKHATT